MSKRVLHPTGVHDREVSGLAASACRGRNDEERWPVALHCSLPRDVRERVAVVGRTRTDRLRQIDGAAAAERDDGVGPRTREDVDATPDVFDGRVDREAREPGATGRSFQRGRGARRLQRMFVDHPHDRAYAPRRKDGGELGYRAGPYRRRVCHHGRENVLTVDMYRAASTTPSLMPRPESLTPPKGELSMR